MKLKTKNTLELIETFDKYLTLPREQAYNQYLDERNLKIFKVILFVFEFIFSILFIVNLATNQSLNVALILIGINLLSIGTALFIYKKVFTISNIRRYIFIFLISQLFLTIAINIFYPEDKEDKEVSHKTEQVDKSKSQKTQKVDTLTKGVTFSVDTERDDAFVQYVFFFVIMV